MAYSINTRKTDKGNWIAFVETGSYGRGHVVHKTAAFADRGEAHRTAEAWRTENTKKNAAAKAIKLQATMTCQCCGRKHLANKGVIAHHGFERPGSGWQTASCYGARHLPFEVSRDALGDMITALHIRKARMIEIRGQAEREEFALSLYYTDYSVKANAYGKRPEVRIEVTRDTFAAVKAAHADGFRRSIHHTSFESVKEDDLSDRARDIKRIGEDIIQCQARYDGWKHTHNWNAANETWIKV